MVSRWDTYQVVFSFSEHHTDGLTLPWTISENPWDWEVKVTAYSLSYLSSLKISDPLILCCNLINRSTYHEDNWFPALLTVPLDKTKGRFIDTDIIYAEWYPLISSQALFLTVHPKTPANGYVVLMFRRKN